MDKISVIVPIFHGKKYIQGLVEQVEKCAENIPLLRVELIFSNDDPKEMIILDNTSSNINVKIFNTDKNRGIHGARVRGLDNSQGGYILFLDQDDEIDGSFLQKQLYLLEHSNADAVVCNALSAGQRKYNLDRPLYKAISRECMIREGNMILSPGQVLMRRDAISNAWKENIMTNNGADDWLLWLCMLSEGIKFVLNEEVLFIRKVHYSNASYDSLKMADSEQEVVAIIEKECILSKIELNLIKNLILELQRERIKENEKWKKRFFILNDWMNLKHKGIFISEKLIEMEIKRIAIYGYNYLGRTLALELESTSVSVAFFIDKNADFLNADIPIYKLEDELEKVDLVIISLVKEHDMALRNKIQAKLNVEVIWLEDMICNL